MGRRGGYLGGSTLMPGEWYGRGEDRSGLFNVDAVMEEAQPVLRKLLRLFSKIDGLILMIKRVRSSELKAKLQRQEDEARAATEDLFRQLEPFSEKLAELGYEIRFPLPEERRHGRSVFLVKLERERRVTPIEEVDVDGQVYSSVDCFETVFRLVRGMWNLVDDPVEVRRVRAVIRRKVAKK